MIINFFQINHHLKTKKKGNHHKIHEDLLMPLLSLKLYHLNNNQVTISVIYRLLKVWSLWETSKFVSILKQILILIFLINLQLTDSVDTKTGSTVAMNRKNAKGLSKKNKHFAEPILVKKNHLHFCVYLTTFVWSVSW